MMVGQPWGSYKSLEELWKPWKVLVENDMVEHVF